MRRMSLKRLLRVFPTLLWLGVLPAVAQHHDRHDARALEADPRLAPGQIAPLLEGLGEHHHPVTTVSERAQRFFDQGLLLTYGFNHQEALRAFKEAARLDPGCAMAYWGWALALGPNLNLPMQPEVVPQAWEAIQLALAHKDRVSAKDRDYIEALALRYTDDPAADRAPLDRAYSEAMGRLRAKYPEDTDAATLYAASLMELSPWDYWTKDRRPKTRTPEILATLESVLERDPRHEGALHYYIHAVEAADPRRGLAAADALRGLAPSAGHLVHMPSHIYMQIGRYADAYEDNAKAAEADESYIAQCRAQGIYPLGYFPHNIHFMVWAAVMQGKSADAIDAARRVASKVPTDLHDNHWGLYESFLAMPLLTRVRFGQWEAVLAEPRPEDDLRFLTGIWRYARGLAFVHTGRRGDARRELAALDRLASDPASSSTGVGLANAGSLLAIAREVLAGEIAAKRGKHVLALGHLDRAVRLEDALAYNEPPDWFLPVRHTLGAVLIEAGRPEEAEIVYWQDLGRHAENGFALFGLLRSLEAQQKGTAEVEARLRGAWSGADVELTTSRF